jgi:hypothetical protein
MLSGAAQRWVAVRAMSQISGSDAGANTPLLPRAFNLHKSAP